MPSTAAISAARASTSSKPSPRWTPTHPLLHSKNTIVTPHVAFASAESMEARCKIVFDNIAQWMDGHQTNIIL